LAFCAAVAQVLLWAQPDSDVGGGGWQTDL